MDTILTPAGGSICMSRLDGTSGPGEPAKRTRGRRSAVKKPHAPALQEALSPAPPVPFPDLREYDLIIVSISGGKDSMAALAETVRHARKAGVLDRVITVFCDLGPGDEWPGTKELAAEH